MTTTATPTMELKMHYKRNNGCSKASASKKDVSHMEALASPTMKRSTTSSRNAISCIIATNDDTYKPQKFFKEARLHLAWEPPPEQKTKVMVAYSVYLDVTFSGPCRMFRHEHKDCKHDHFVKNTNNY
ncbi:uncharacterized protein LOC116804695 [Drosophila mojavensis]|uniref:uncharacterized protein LOC116804695 n=1 Tax=Drosophila mojavensis TaxID=7230 RepID=UPI0013EEB1E7|nr:uncharacterized protein LOC116804695 [Drosophila mojavensis]